MGIANQQCSWEIKIHWQYIYVVHCIDMVDNWNKRTVIYVAGCEDLVTNYRIEMNSTKWCQSAGQILYGSGELLHGFHDM